MQCCICGSENWTNVDEYREDPIRANPEFDALEFAMNDKYSVPATIPVNMCVCETCGFVTYPTLFKDEAAMIKYYRKAYRGAPNYSGLVTGHRKLVYHDFFLQELFAKWKAEGLDAPVIGEVGSAFGMTLNWLRGKFPKADINGTELTTSFKNVAWGEYKIALGDELDKTKKYDLLISYKVLEHQMNPHEKLAELRSLLKPGGYLYLSVPTWFNEFSDFGKPSTDLKYYYDTNHINVWTEKLFKTLLSKHKFHICKEDVVLYNDTYLLKADDKIEPVINYENPAEIKETMKKIKTAYLHYKNNNMDAAVESYANFPLAWRGRYELQRANPHRQDPPLTFAQIFESYVAPAIKACPRSLEAYIFAGDLCQRYDMYEKSIEFFQKALDQRPNYLLAMSAMMNSFRQLSIRAVDPNKKVEYLEAAVGVGRTLAQIDLGTRPEAMSQIYGDMAKLDYRNYVKPRQNAASVSDLGLQLQNFAGG